MIDLEEPVRSHKVLARQVQRVEQGMGRGVRDAQDHCAVLLVGDDLTRVIHDPKQRALFSPATRVQIEVSRDLSTQIHGQGMDLVREAIDLCLDQDTAWVEAGRRKLAQTDYNDEAFIRPSAIAARLAFDKAVRNDFRGAEAELQTATNATDNPAEKGRLMEPKAAYLNVSSAPDAQRLLLQASIQNHHVLRPIAGVSVERLRAAAVQARAVAAYAAEAACEVALEPI